MSIILVVFYQTLKDNIIRSRGGKTGATNSNHDFSAKIFLRQATFKTFSFACLITFACATRVASSFCPSNCFFFKFI